MILSSEYLSLHRPAAIAAFVADLEALGADARFLIFSREPVPWLRSLFNQYVKTVDSGPHFRSIDAFADHVLTNGAIDIARRYQAWADAVGASRLAHHRIAPGQPPEDVLTPFSEFAGLPIAAAEPGANRSLSPGALYLTGLIRQALPTPGRDLLLARIAASDCAWVPVPADYLEIGPEQMARLDDDIAAPFAALPRANLPVPTAAIRVPDADGQPVYRSVDEALENRFGSVPSPVELAEQIKAGEFLKPVRLLQMVLQFYGSMKYEKLHPLQSGLFRRKLRTTRRYGLPLESPLVFYPRRLWEILSSYLPFGWYWLRMQLLRKRIENDPRAKEYTDLALTPVVEAEDEALELFAETGGGEAAVAKAKAQVAARQHHAARVAAD